VNQSSLLPDLPLRGPDPDNTRTVAPFAEWFGSILTVAGTTLPIISAPHVDAYSGPFMSVDRCYQ